jgi:hypothetical protein
VDAEPDLLFPLDWFCELNDNVLIVYLLNLHH